MGAKFTAPASIAADSKADASPPSTQLAKSVPPVFRGSRVVWFSVGELGAVPVPQSALSAAAPQLRLATGAHVPVDYYADSLAPVFLALHRYGLLSTPDEAEAQN